MSRLLKFVIFCFLIAGPAVVLAAQGERKDVDGDGYREAEVFYSKGAIVKTLIDFDHDGRMESVIYYRDGYREKAEQDVNGDGKTDRWVSYYFTGIPWKVAEDTDGDGKPDYWTFLKNGWIYKWEQDRDGNGAPDVRTIYDPNTSKRRTLVHQSFDNDFDGFFESLSGVTAVREDAAFPHSLAEALLRG